MAILITVVESTNQIISGIPEYVVVESNTPAVIFYTFDGTDPTIDSDFMESNTLVLPTDQSSVTVKLKAIAGIDSSEIFEHEWSTVVSFVTRRFKDTDGISILPPDAEVVDSLSVNVDGDAARETSIPFVDLEMKASDRDVYKRHDGGKTSLAFINFNLELIMAAEVPYQSKTSSPNDNNLDFDPKAGLIIIDGSTPEKLASQSVKIINRPYNTIPVRSGEYNEHLVQQPIITGNLVRYMTNPKTGKTVFYYFDSRECRWIHSIQQITPKQLNIGNMVGNPKVFAWISDPVMSKIF
jgi:hypothetical protein